MLESDKPQMTIWHMRTACWITKATNAHSEYVILFALPLQQWLRERASMLLYYTACLVVFIIQNNELERMSGNGRGLL
jgi:hypothetical protein